MVLREKDNFINCLEKLSCRWGAARKASWSQFVRQLGETSAGPPKMGQSAPESPAVGNRAIESVLRWPNKLNSPGQAITLRAGFVARGKHNQACFFFAKFVSIPGQEMNMFQSGVVSVRTALLVNLVTKRRKS